MNVRLGAERSRTPVLTILLKKKAVPILVSPSYARYANYLH